MDIIDIDFFNFLLEQYKLEIENYKNANVFKSAFRLNLEIIKNICVLLLSFFNNTPTVNPTVNPTVYENMEELRSLYNIITINTELLYITNTNLMEKTTNTITINTHNDKITLNNLDVDMYNNIQHYIQLYKEQSANTSAVLNSLKKMSDIELKNYLEINYDSPLLLDIFQSIYNKWPEQLFINRIFDNYPYSNTLAIDKFKFYSACAYKNNNISPVNFSRIITKAKINPLYIRYLLYDFGKDIYSDNEYKKTLKMICSDLRGLQIDYPLLKLYHPLCIKYYETFMKKEEALKCVFGELIYRCIEENKDNLIELKLMVVYLFENFNIDYNNKKVLLNYCRFNCLNYKDVLKGLTRLNFV